MVNVVLSDLDSTLADTRGRAHLAARASGHFAWMAYSRACETDAPMPGPIRTLQLLALSFPVFLVSGRNYEAEKETRRWLAANMVPYTRLRLRTEHDIQHNGEYKVNYIRHLRTQGYTPVLMLEDHVGVAEMIEAEGVPVLSVNPRYDDSVGVNFNNLSTEPLEARLF